MLPKISVVTLVVDDLARSIEFYSTGLGLPTPVLAKGGYALFNMGAVRLALCPRQVLVNDLGGNVARMMTVSTVSQNVPQASDVDEILVAAVEAGGALVTEPKNHSNGGRRGWFSDPDGHLWEIVYNPACT